MKIFKNNYFRYFFWSALMMVCFILELEYFAGWCTIFAIAGLHKGRILRSEPYNSKKQGG